MLWRLWNVDRSGFSSFVIWLTQCCYYSNVQGHFDSNDFFCFEILWFLTLDIWRCWQIGVELYRRGWHRAVVRCVLQLLNLPHSINSTNTVLSLTLNTPVCKLSIQFSVQSFSSRWSFPSFSRPWCLFQGWFCTEKLDASHT